MNPGITWPLDAPFTPMFCILVGALLALVWLALFIEKSYQKQSDYRCAGLILLSQATSCESVHLVLKRVAVTAYPDINVNGLYGGAWVRFLNQSCSSSHFRHQWLRDLQARPSAALVAEARHWILQHHRKIESRRVQGHRP